MTLTALITADDWTGLEEKWTELMLAQGPIEEVHRALELAARKKEIPRIVPLARDHADLLRGADRGAEAAELLGRTMLLGGSPGELAKPLYDAAEAAWGNESWWDTYTKLAELNENTTDMRSAWRTFQKLVSLREKVVIHHASGWGFGQVLALDANTLEVDVRFTSGRSDRFPMKTAVDIFEVIPEEDMRSWVVADPEGLKKMLKEDPLRVLESVLRRQRGRVGLSVIKSSMLQLGLSTSGFTTWWRRTRKLAEASPWIEIIGTSTKTQVQLLTRKADPIEALRREITLGKDLATALARVRTLFGGGGESDPALREVALESIESRASDPSEALGPRLAVWMLLREERGETPETLTAEFRAAAEQPAPQDPSRPPALWALVNTIPGARDQERCIGLLEEIFGREFLLEEAARHLEHAAPGMVRGLVDLLMAADRRSDLGDKYSLLVRRPTRNPHVLVALAEHAERGRLEGEFPQPIHRAQSLVRLASHLHNEKVTNQVPARARTKLTTLLTDGDPTVLGRLLQGADRAMLRSVLNLAERGVPREVERELTNLVVKVAPELFTAGERPFWEDGSLWSSAEGLRRKQEELRELTEVLIPANSEAIGKAASYGDLSENSEWEAAMDEQRQLTTRASDLEEELRSARPIEGAVLPADTVCPGTRVKVLNEDTKEEEVFTILGPWDDFRGDGFVSYRAPLAAGLLGHKAGDTATLALPSGERQVRVLEVETFDLG